ncbi:MAG: aminopeptidase [bacterium]
MKSKLELAAIIAIKDCMAAKKKEKILIVSDENKREIGLCLYDAAIEMGNESLYLEMKSREMHGEEPPDYIAEMMKLFDIVLCPTTKSLTHTSARRNASEVGVRVATFPGITKEVMVRGLSADYKKISDLTMKLKKMLEDTEIIHVTAKNGTDIKLEVKGRTAYASNGLFHKKGQSGNLPTGEAFLAPLEGKSNGVFVVDGSMAGIGMITDKDLRIVVEDGFATEITGGKEAKELLQILSKYGKNARNIAEFGIGTNDKAKLSGLLLEDEKVLGTIHIALGDNKSMGGSVHIPLHLDGVVKKPTVYFDDKMIMKEGKLLV